MPFSKLTPLPSANGNVASRVRVKTAVASRYRRFLPSDSVVAADSDSTHHQPTWEPCNGKDSS
jgi:hypothetical protein